MTKPASHPDRPSPRTNRADEPPQEGPGSPKGPKRPEDTTSSGDAKSGAGEDNQSQKEDG